MFKHLVTGGCSFSHSQDIENNWVGGVSEYLKTYNPNITFSHTGYLSSGQEMIQKKMMLSITEELERGTLGQDILAIVMWSGTYRKSWYIDNSFVIDAMVKDWSNFEGGMSNQFIDLKNEISNPNTFNTNNGSKFTYNKDGGWYFTVNGSDSNMEFVQQHYILDGYLQGVGKIHSSIENIVMLQNFCKLNNVKLVHQFFMDSVFEDIEINKNHQIINYLYKQLDKKNFIEKGFFEYLHNLLNISSKDAIDVTHEQRKILDKNTKYFAEDGFHPSKIGANLWVQNILIPFLIPFLNQ